MSYIDMGTDDIVFQTGATNDATISANNGTVTLSSSSGGCALEGVDQVGTTSSQEYVDFSTSDTVAVKINNTAELTVASGAVTVTNTCIADDFALSSSRELKMDFKELKNSLENVTKLTGLCYTRKSTGVTECGFIAEDVQAAFPEAVTERGNYPSIRPVTILATVVEAIKELNDKFEQWTKKVNKLTKTVDRLKKKKPSKHSDDD